MNTLLKIKLMFFKLTKRFNKTKKFFCKKYNLTITLLDNSRIQITKEYKLDKLKFGAGEFSTHAIEFAKWMKLLVDLLEKFSSNRNDINVQIINDKVVTSIIVKTKSIVDTLNSYHFGEMDVWNDHTLFTSDYVETFYSERRLTPDGGVALYDDKDLVRKPYNEIIKMVAIDNIGTGWGEIYKKLEEISIDDPQTLQTKDLGWGKIYFDNKKSLGFGIYEDNNVILTKLLNYSAFEKRADKYQASLDLMSFITEIKSMLKEVQTKLVSPNQLTDLYDMKMVLFFSNNIFSYSLEVADTNFEQLAKISEFPIFSTEVAISNRSVEHSGNLYQLIKDIDITLQEEY